MKYLKWIVGLAPILAIILFAHYSLPGRDIVQIVGTDVVRQGREPSNPSGIRSLTRDVRFISTARPDGTSSVYRNEDTGWGWPPYFKFDSSDLTAQAQAYVRQENQWVAITHYGWRIDFFSVYPNAVKITQVEGPDVRLIPWFNIIFLTTLGILAILVIRAILAFKRRRIDPIIEDIDIMIDDAGDDMDAARKNFRDWWSNLFKKSS